MQAEGQVRDEDAKIAVAGLPCFLHDSEGAAVDFLSVCVLPQGIEQGRVLGHGSRDLRVLQTVLGLQHLDGAAIHRLGILFVAQVFEHKGQVGKRFAGQRIFDAELRFAGGGEAARQGFGLVVLALQAEGVAGVELRGEPAQGIDADADVPCARV